METKLSIQKAPETKGADDKYGLVLGGGGSKGCYHVGVWQAMNEAGITFDAVTGTSIGALVGIFYPGNNIGPVTDFVMNMEPGNIAEELPVMPVTLKEKIKGTKTILQFVIKYFESKMDITPLRRHFEAMFDYETFAASPVKYACMSYNETAKEPRAFYKGEITADNAEQIVMASSACYPAFPKVTIDGETYIDGMYADNVPIALLKRILPEAKWSVVVDLHDPQEALPPALDESMFYIEPLLQPGNPLDFSRTHAEKLYSQGYLEAGKYLGKYPGYLYTFTEDSQVFMDILEDYLGKQITQMKAVLPKRADLPAELFRSVLGYYPPLLNNGRNSNYEFGKMVEALALIAGLEPVALYDYRQFLQMLMTRLSEQKILDHNPEEYLLVNLFGSVTREEMPNVLYRMLKNNNGRFSERIESMKERIPVSYTLAIIRYALDLLFCQLEGGPQKQSGESSSAAAGQEKAADQPSEKNEAKADEPAKAAGQTNPAGKKQADAKPSSIAPDADAGKEQESGEPAQDVLPDLPEDEWLPAKTPQKR